MSLRSICPKTRPKAYLAWLRRLAWKEDHGSVGPKSAGYLDWLDRECQREAWAEWARNAKPADPPKSMSITPWRSRLWRAIMGEREGPRRLNIKY